MTESTRAMTEERARKLLTKLVEMGYDSMCEDEDMEPYDEALKFLATMGLTVKDAKGKKLTIVKFIFGKEVNEDAKKK